MKKILTVLFAVLLTVCASGCEKNLINDADTGEIVIAENKYSYADGVYYSHFDYFDENGLCGVVKMQIEDGIIKSVRFDYFDKEQNPYSEGEDRDGSDAIASFRALRKNLYTHTLTEQNMESIENTGPNSPTSDYRILAGEIIYGAQHDTQKIIKTESAVTYTKAMPLTETVFANLQISYVSDKISDISFDITDKYYASMIPHEQTCMDIFSLTSAQVSDAIDILENTDTEIKENTEESLKLIFDVYNSLAAQIMDMHTRPEFDFDELF